ncbi:MAG: UDPglucose 6-dehydrogenase [Microgenomates group bacterium Gr01-1014_5]|nr:MAG: UDPglucose 6-dehydrogenase [Microgenomates group bacterium Gr01-1014_5]
MIKIGVLGLWHLGCVYSACLAKQGFEVCAFDLNKKVVDNLKNNTPPIFEPGLEDLIQKLNRKNLNFTSSACEAVLNRDYVFITLDTPVNDRDIVSLQSFNLLIKEVEKYIQPKTILVISSQVPIGTCRVIQKQLMRSGKDNHVLYFPENLRLGQALDVFLKPDRIVLGGSEKARKKFLSDFSFFKCTVLKMSLESAEMAKHSLNSYLALMISFASEVSDLCERLGANATDVMKALKTDQRVSVYAPLNPGIGFAGGTLGRDLQTLRTISRKIKYSPKLIRAAYQVNQDRLPRFIDKISRVAGSLKGKKVGLLGLTYKPNTNTLRRSQSLELAGLLKALGANVRAIDPAIDGSTAETKSLKVCQKNDEFFKGLDVIILMTGWEEFKKLKPEVFSLTMKQKIVFDARNFLDKELWEKAGFLYEGIGVGVGEIKAQK